MTDLTQYIVNTLCRKDYHYESKMAVAIFESCPIEWEESIQNKAYDIKNPYLYALFVLRKLEYYVNGQTPEIKELYHVTTKGSMDSVLKKNLDWRHSHRQRYGPGVCFSHFISYSLRHSSARRCTAILIKFLVLVGTTESRYPYETKTVSTSCDTGMSYDKIVYVKAREDEFYPIVVYL